MKQLLELISDLGKYKGKGKFQLKPTDVLSQVCNIPRGDNYSGLYLIYDNTEKLIYVGISGRYDKKGGFIHRKGGLHARFLSGKQFGARRSSSLSNQMKIEGISSLNIHWFITYGGGDIKDIPRLIEQKIIETSKLENDGKRPKWNKQD